jgi:hypothetical protein
MPAPTMAIERGFAWLIIGFVSCQIPLVQHLAQSCALPSQMQRLRVDGAGGMVE